MSLLDYTGPIYRQTKKKFFLEDECKILIESELQVDSMASKAVNVRFICTLQYSIFKYSVGFWSHARVFSFFNSFVVSYERLIWLTRLLFYALMVSLWYPPTRVSDANSSPVISVELCPGNAQGVMGKRKPLFPPCALRRGLGRVSSECL